MAARQRKGNFFEIGICETDLLAIAIGFDQTDFGGEAVKRVPQGRAQTGVLGEIQHTELLIVDC